MEYNTANSTANNAENNIQKKNTNWQTIVILILVVIIAVISVFSIGKLNDMTDTMNAMQNQHSYEVNILRNEISEIYDTVDAQLKKQASLVSGVEYTCGELDTQTHQVAVELKVVPKNIVAGMELTVRVGDTVADFTRDGSVFTATMPVDMFIAYETYPILSILVGDETKTELLEDVDVSCLYYQYLPEIFAEPPSFYVVSDGKLTLDETFHIDCKSVPSGVSVTKLALVIEENGKEVERKDLTSEIGSGSCEVAIHGSYSLKDGDELVIYTVAEDSLGYTHKSIVYHWLGGGENDDAIEVIDGINYIYDREGNLLNEHE